LLFPAPLVTPGSSYFHIPFNCYYSLEPQRNFSETRQKPLFIFLCCLSKIFTRKYKKTNFFQSFRKVFISFFCLDREQRELYEAAKIIQQAYRQYRARITIRRQNEAKQNAAIVIQNYYRRYKQYCYFKKLHKAAMLIQKHFRMRKAVQNQRGTEESKLCSNSQIRVSIENCQEINAFVKSWLVSQGHYYRKRQRAACKIQKFMRQIKQKLAYHSFRQ
uniref:Calmodulin binding transcription activator 1a n=1 Tax=Thelazia callipaeda TaxID=103827 RepID=A0A0N5CJI5_THECL